MKSTEESFSSEKCLRGANVFSVSVRHISLSGPRSSQVFWYLQQLSVISSLLSGRDGAAWTGRWAAEPGHHIIQPTTLLCITKYVTEREKIHRRLNIGHRPGINHRVKCSIVHRQNKEARQSTNIMLFENTLLFVSVIFISRILKSYVWTNIKVFVSKRQI